MSRWPVNTRPPGSNWLTGAAAPLSVNGWHPSCRSRTEEDTSDEDIRAAAERDTVQEVEYRAELPEGKPQGSDGGLLPSGLPD
ncbi:hypothetical protein KX16_003627 [Salmonella enterica subsp. enterica]|nr:hypothetical protein [Salmonella enterica subsp. enterica serovar Mikawasima]